MPEIPLVMPKMSMTMTEGIFVAWHKQPGDAVRSGDVVAEVTTDKVDMEVESPIDGVLARLVAEPEDVVPVGEPIAFLTSDTDDLLGDLLGGDDDAASSDASGGAETADADTPAASDGAPAEATSDGAGAAAEGAAPADADAGPADSASRDADTDGAGSGNAGAAAADGTGEGVAAVDSPQVDTPPTTRPDPPESSSPPPTRSSAPASRSSSPAPSRPSSPPASASSSPSSTDNGWVASVPLARERARELRVDLADVRGTGPGGAVRVVDVESAASAPAASAPAASAAPTARGSAADRAADRRRAALAKRMTESASVPQFVVFRDLDLDDLAAARDGVSWTAVLLTAYAAVLRDDPVLHARWAGERRQPHDEVVVSVAVDTPDGLLAPSISAPDRMPLREVDDALHALAARAREGRLSVADLTPGTTTVSNLGGLGVDAFTVLLSPPQATALSLGAVGPVPVAVPGGLGVRVRCRAGLAVDHRVADGADAARLLQRLQDRCADPASLGL